LEGAAEADEEAKPLADWDAMIAAATSEEDARRRIYDVPDR